MLMMNISVHAFLFIGISTFVEVKLVWFLKKVTKSKRKYIYCPSKITQSKRLGKYIIIWIQCNFSRMILVN